MPSTSLRWFLLTICDDAIVIPGHHSATSATFTRGMIWMDGNKDRLADTTMRMIMDGHNHHHFFSQCKSPILD